MDNVKQVYATLKLDDNKVDILVGEFYNTRFNIICTYSAPISGISDFNVIDSDSVVEGLKEAIANVSKKVGATLEKVILVLPPYNFSRTSLKVSIIPSDSCIKKKDIARAITNALKTTIDDESLVINTHITKYTVNGISYRRLPENETCDEAYIDIDLLCGDKRMAFDYVEVVNKAGLEILDLVLADYAIAKESVALENSLSHNIILLNINNEETYLSLIYKTKLLSSEIIHTGLKQFCDLAIAKYHLPYAVCSRLLKYNVDYKSEHLNDAIYAWNDGDKNNSLVIKDLNELVDVPLNAYVDKIVATCKPIIEKGASFLLTGEGSEMLAISELLKEKSGVEVKNYYPDIIGARKANMCANYGALFVYREKAVLNELSVNCVNIAEYDKTIDRIEEDVEGESITSKIKNLFETYKESEEK